MPIPHPLPQTLESLYLLWKITGEPRWRERAWKIFESIEIHTKTTSGYASLRSVESTPGVKQDDMPRYVTSSLPPWTQISRH